MATIKDVAKLAGVSIATVSRYMNQSPTLTDEYKEKVEAAIKELHYVPNTVAKALKSQNTSTIAIIVPEMSNPFFAAVYTSLRKMALDEGYYTALFAIDEDASVYDSLEHQVLSGFYAGVIIILLDYPAFAPYVKRIAAALPTVLVSTANHNDINNCIVIDTFDAEYRATQYMIEKGRKKIAYINGNIDRQSSLDKLGGYKKCMRDYHLPLDESLIYAGKYTSSDGFFATRQFMMRDDAPDAIVCANDIIAIGAIKYLIQHGYSIPDDVSVIGMDGTPYAYSYTPSITTMEIPIEAICQEATSMLFKNITHRRSAPMNRIFQTTLIENTSTNKDAPVRFYL